MNPGYPESDLITGAEIERYAYHTAIGDMWPLTWGNDNNIYAAAGDNRGSPMNFWRIAGAPERNVRAHSHDWMADIVNDHPVDPLTYFAGNYAAGADRTRGLKPAGLLDIDGTVFMAIETMNYGDERSPRRRNLTGFIASTNDYGVSFNAALTPVDFFTGRLASCHFLQFGMGYRDSRDAYVYAYFQASDDGCSYFSNNDYMLLARVRLDSEGRGGSAHDILRNKYDLTDRGAWEFYAGEKNGEVIWEGDDSSAAPVFKYKQMTGENQVCYNAGLNRYILGNYSFIDGFGDPFLYYGADKNLLDSRGITGENIRSQLTLFEAPEPWGPWSIFYRDDHWGETANYQPVFPTKWILDGGRTMFMVSSGTPGDYNFAVRKMTLKARV